MKKSLLKSRIILQSEEKIKQYGDKAIEEFLCNLKHKGTPIIEELENDTENNLVTFIYQGNKECKSVLFVPDIGLDRLQVGIDVLPEYRGRGIGTNLVILLKNEILKRGKIPFYGTAESHFHSQNIAINAGFFSAWSELYSREQKQG